jgi:uncharacterized protein (DUF983 family)
MKEYPIDDRLRREWKLPLNLAGLSISKCCDEPTRIVRSMQGGFVTRNCPRCKKGPGRILPEHVFNKLKLNLSCPQCGLKLRNGKDGYGNYVLICDGCRLFVKLADLVPHWSEI